MRTEVEKLIFLQGPPARYTFASDEPSTRDGQDIGSSRFASMEPTFACPTGVPGDTVIKLRSSSFETILAWQLHKEGAYYEGLRTEVPETIAHRIFKSESNRNQQLAGPEDVRYRTGIFKQWHFDIPLTRNLGLAPTLYDTKVNHGPYMRLRDLPTSTQEAVEAALKRLRENAANRAKQQKPPP